MAESLNGLYRTETTGSPSSAAKNAAASSAENSAQLNPP
jgi:hypothetical protein